jgi:hypothetical protein
MKCAICKEKVEETFLKKPLGTYIKNEKGKKYLICQKCQKAVDNIKEKMLEKI